MRSRRRHARRRLLSLPHWRTRIVFWLGAGLVGAISAGFAIIAQFADGSFRSLAADSPYVAYFWPPVGLMIVAWLTYRFVPQAGGSGIPQAVAALQLRKEHQRRELLSFRIAVGKIALTVLALGSGASVGREGPTVHVGASMMTFLGRAARFPPQALERALILAGGAGGIAAAFNTPLAGILFAIEELSRSFEERSNGTVMMMVLISGVTALAILGDYSYFGSNDSWLESAGDWLAVPVCGVVGGAAGGLFAVSLIAGSRRLAPFMRRRPVMVAGLCGIAIAAIGFASAGLTYGTGYTEAAEVVIGSDRLPMSYPLLKALATIASYLSGVPGGIFAPSLATGATLGSQIALVFPETPSGALVLLGMVAYFTGVVRAPMTGLVIVMEMTENSAMLMPLLASSLIANGVSYLICPESLYHALARPFVRHEPTPGPKSRVGHAARDSKQTEAENRRTG
ncbi:MAG: chloride channel protein [Chromatiaceae bacterium]